MTSAQDPLIEAILGGLLGSVVGTLATLAYSEVRRRRERSGVRAQIVFLLRHLQIHVGMMRDYPAYYFCVARPLVTELAKLTLTPLSGSGLTVAERDAVFLAVNQTDQESSFLAADRTVALESGDVEYLRASAVRAFSALQTARRALRDRGTLIRPVDPRSLHKWISGESIAGSEVL